MRGISHHLTVVAFSLAAVSACGDNNTLPGRDGADALVVTSVEASGANCENGGTKIEAGIDDNGNGTLDEEEVTSTSYACDGGSGKNTLVRTSAEPAGSNCPFAGTRIETGLDANDDGVLDAGEVDAAATSYVCNVAPNGVISPSTGLVLAYKGVSTSTTDPITVRFTLKDDRGFPVDIKGAYSVNTPISPRFALSYFTKDGTTGIVSPLNVYTKTTSTTAPNGQPTAYSPSSTSSAFGTLVENGLGAGDYTYSFPTTSTTNGPVAIAYDTTKLNETHVVWTQATRQTDLVFTINANTYFAANQPHYFIPSGSGTPGVREIVKQEKCDSCHGKFKAETTTSAAFHGGGRVAAGMCNVCHNPGRTTNPFANSASFVHRIHHGTMIATDNLFHDVVATYPRDIRDCNTCHEGAAQGNQALINPSTIACGSCHDYVKFDNSAADTCRINGALLRGSDGKPVECDHVGGIQPESNCVTCHGPAGGFATTRYHKPVAPPDPNNGWLVLGGSNNTNASFVAAGTYVPPDADVITYDLKSVEAVLDTNANVKRPQMTFKLKRDGVDVVFQNPSIATELMADFVGSPSAYFAFAVPQDGNPTPADFNATVSGYIKKIWDGSATGTGAGELTGPDTNGYYTIRLTGVQIPPAATMLTGGLGYTYSLTSPPLVQTNVADYPWTPNNPADGKAQGGLSVPAPNVWKVANSYTGRRPIVDNAKCNNCHGKLGVTPSFHAGQRNDGPTCSFCHTPNRSSAGWAAGSKYFIHAIHAGRKRTVDFTWHAVTVGPGYDEIEFPGALNTCTTCHVPGSYEFTSTANFGAISRMQLSTAATGTLDPNPLTNSKYYTISPYVSNDGVTNYGSGFSYNAETNTTTEAAGTTLVHSQITGACVACHDSQIAVAHMKQAGGQFYGVRSTVLGLGPSQEQCLICHGPGRIAAIGIVHQR